MIYRRDLLRGAAALATATTWTALRAQVPDFPNRPLQLTVAFAPGGAGGSYRAPHLEGNGRIPRQADHYR